MADSSSDDEAGPPEAELDEDGENTPYAKLTGPALCTVGAAQSMGLFTVGKPAPIEYKRDAR